MLKALVAIDIRSAHNVGALMRLCAAFGIDRLYLTGITPYPRQENDRRLPHVIAAAERKLGKTALDAWLHIKAVRYWPDPKLLLDYLKQNGHILIALEHDRHATDLSRVKLSGRPAVLIIGNEVQGLDETTKSIADLITEIKLPGQKHSLNVATAAAIALYALTKPL